MMPEYRYRDKRDYVKNIVGIAGIIFLIGYYFIGLRAGLFILGSFLLAEHIFEWGVFQARDIIGHEYLGALLMILSAQNWIVTIITILICIVNIEFYAPWSPELIKLKNIFNDDKI